jgi:hypothetical protein
MNIQILSKMINNPALTYMTLVFIISITFYVYRYFINKPAKTSSIFFNLYCASIFGIMLHLIAFASSTIAWILGTIAIIFLSSSFVSNLQSH